MRSGLDDEMMDGWTEYLIVFMDVEEREIYWIG